MSLLRDFRDFVGKSSAIDLAVGLIVGSAITTIFTSFVQELIVPLTGLISKADFSNSYFVLKGVVPEGLPLPEARKIAGAVVLGYGQFATVLINTLILAFVVFLVIRSINKLRQRMAREEVVQPSPLMVTEVQLLTEIRDLLKRT